MQASDKKSTNKVIVRVITTDLLWSIGLEPLCQLPFSSSVPYFRNFNYSFFLHGTCNISCSIIIYTFKFPRYMIL